MERVNFAKFCVHCTSLLQIMQILTKTAPLDFLNNSIATTQNSKILFVFTIVNKKRENLLNETMSDKGGKAVILDKSTYNEFVNENVRNHNDLIKYLKLEILHRLINFIYLYVIRVQINKNAKIFSFLYFEIFLSANFVSQVSTIFKIKVFYKQYY